MSTEQNGDVPFKVVLVGETAVGKSCLIAKYIKNTFQSNFVPTMGGAFFTKEIFIKELDKKIKFEVWDTAGQEKYRSITKMYYKDANAAILVYDITREESFLEIKKFWFNEVKDNSPESTVIAIPANKKDLYEYEEVSKDTGENFAFSQGAIFKETSAKEGNGVNELFKMIGIKLLSPEYYEKMMNTENGKFQRMKKSSILISSGGDNKDELTDSKFVSGGLKNSTLSANNNKKKGCC